ncbi:uncharacterized protein LOC142632460 [Castanea sativa]|uniref:uncharacterized protein LOC142632460 n=1 Tax=Castanea sativa TaxID=21020 RepID=UPI003F64DBB3
MHFRVGARKFLGYLITKRGIEVNPDQIEAVKRLKPPSNLKKVQRLTGMLAALNRFISKFADRCRPFYQLLKKWKGYMLRNSVKGQVLTDFIADFSPKSMEMVCLVGANSWKVFVDGASNTTGARAGAGVVVITPEGIKLEHSFRLDFRASNNKAEYEALLAGLRVLSDLGAKEVEVYLHSHLIVNQVQGSFEAKDPRMIEYLRLVKQTMGNFSSLRVE